ncbi:hypothetical protein H9Q72_014442 [Fusarium xylarioides]|uniref:Peptidase S8/S53 domain-containing protein n=1 Tax=Fusarium xylarioides TaxID=221167 RepID=A0A9P7HBT6_9HYPO|nr:hypothetical protein H9Q72_014442 [Fusarium xylarioides]
MTKVPAKATYVLEVDHPEFEGRARFVQNFVDNADLDANGHGTNIAGTIGSKTYGVAKKTQLFAVKVLNEYTAGQTSGILAGMDFMCSESIVVNMSLSVASSPAINAAARYIVKSGYFLAVAAGNDDTDASHVTGLAAYFLGLKDIKASKICNLIASMSLIDVIKGIPENTVNLLIQNGEAK